MTDPVTPAMIKAAWAVGRQFWPSKVVERGVACKCVGPKRLMRLETCGGVSEPTPGFKEAITAALIAGGYISPASKGAAHAGEPLAGTRIEIERAE